MILPPGYEDYNTYFQDALKYFFEYQWFYNFPNTKVLVLDVLSHIPDSWYSSLLSITSEELKQVPQGFVKDDWPASLVEFCQRSSSLCLNLEKHSKHVKEEIPEDLKRGLSHKKQHEVSKMMELIRQECQSSGIMNILDIGAGMGYLGSLIHHSYGYKVLGLESKETIVRAALYRQKKFCSSKTAVNYIVSNISSDSAGEVQEYLVELLNNSGSDCSCGVENNCNITDDPLQAVSHSYKSDFYKVNEHVETNEAAANILNPSKEKYVDNSKKFCMVGLHACGDLTVNAISLFLQLPLVMSLIIIPCCYHKMSFKKKCEREYESNQTTTMKNSESHFIKTSASSSNAYYFSRTKDSKYKLEKDFDINSESNAHAFTLEIEEEVFEKFPVSEALKHVILSCDLKSSIYLRRPLFRLAAQTTASRCQNLSKDEHSQQSLNLISRAILELFAHEDNIILKKKHRRGVRHSKLCKFENFVEEASLRYEFLNNKTLEPLDFIENDVNKSYFHSRMTTLWNLHIKSLQKMEVLIVLQNMMQSVAEHFLILDKTAFLESIGCVSYNILKVADDHLSPRCIAIVARKKYT